MKELKENKYKKFKISFEFNDYNYTDIDIEDYKKDIENTIVNEFNSVSCEVDKLEVKEL